MDMSGNSFSKAYLQGYFAGYQAARNDMEQQIDRQSIESSLLSHPIVAMELCSRTFNSLNRAGFHYVGDLTDLSDARIVTIRGLGAKGRSEIARWLDNNGIVNTAWGLFL